MESLFAHRISILLFVRELSIFNDKITEKMNQQEPKKINPIIGKTYSLYGGESSSDNYYSAISNIADKLTEEFLPPEELCQ